MLTENQAKSWVVRKWMPTDEEYRDNPVTRLCYGEAAYYVSTDNKGGPSIPFPFYRREDAIRACDEIQKRWPLSDPSDTWEKIKQDCGGYKGVQKFLGQLLRW